MLTASLELTFLCENIAFEIQIEHFCTAFDMSQICASEEWALYFIVHEYTCKRPKRLENLKMSTPWGVGVFCRSVGKQFVVYACHKNMQCKPPLAFMSNRFI